MACVAPSKEAIDVSNGHGFGMHLGKISPIAQVSATALIALMVWHYHEDSRQQAKDTWAIMYEEMKQAHETSENRWNVVRENQKITIDLANSVKELADEIKRHRDKSEKPHP